MTDDPLETPATDPAPSLEPAPEPAAPEPTLAPPLETPADRLDNPFVPAEPYRAPENATASTVIKLWAGGEHRNAMNLADALKLGADDLALVRSSCPGWDELRGQ